MSDTEEQKSVSEHGENDRKDNQGRTSNSDGKKEEKKKEEKKEKEEKKGDEKKDEKKTEEDEKNDKQPFFKNELKRLKTSLQRESSKIRPPKVRPHFPYVFTDLAPYYNTYTASYLIESEEEVPIPHGYMMRRTAIGLCDPWDDLRMDREMLPKIMTTPRGNAEKKKQSKSRGTGEGSTRLPKFPAVKLNTGDIADRKLNYDDVRMLRNTLREKYSANAGEKIDADYKRTKQDYTRMELNKLDEIHPSNRGNMKSAYFAYLRNTPGSSKAINECVKGTEEELQKEKEKRKEQQQQPVEARS